MDETSRAVGAIEAKVEKIEADVAEIKNDVKGLTRIKWQAAGGLGMLFALAELLHVFLKGA